MKKFTTLTSKAIALPIKDIDTDLIIPAQFLTRVSDAGYGDCLFRRLRDSDPNFPLNQPRYQGAEILVADDNFGCGSSREHAVWALRDGGFKVVIAKSFADIFAGNAANNGLLLIKLAPEVMDQMINSIIISKGTPEITVDLGNQVVSYQGENFSFDYDPFRKHCLINGLETIDYLDAERELVTEFAERHLVSAMIPPLRSNTN